MRLWMKDQNGREMDRPFAPDKRQTKEDMQRVRIEPTEPKYTVTHDKGRIRVTKVGE